jgi:hypothetical protein
MKKAFLLTSCLAVSSLFADDIKITSSDQFDLSTKGQIVDIYASEGVTDVNVSVSADNLYYLFAGDNSSTITTQPNAKYTVTGGATIARGGGGGIFGIRDSAGSSATFTLKDGTYNIGSKNGLFENIDISATSSSTTGNSQKLIFDSTSTTNVFTSQLVMKANLGTTIEINGVFNVYNIALPSLTKNVVVPTNAPYSKFNLQQSGSFKVASTGTINTDTMVITNTKSTFDGTLNLKTTSITHALSLAGNTEATFNSGSKLYLESEKRILLSGNATLTVNQGAMLEAEYIQFGNNPGVGAKLILNGKDVFKNPAGTGDSNLLIVGGYKADIKVSQTNSFGMTSVNKQSEIFLELAFTDAESYINFGKIRGASVTEAIFKVKNFENNRIKGYLGDQITGTQLWLYDEKLEDYVQLNADKFGWVDAGNGYFWLNMTAVPEPAEWAMIFGGIALALAIYRRRK